MSDDEEEYQRQRDAYQASEERQVEPCPRCGARVEVILWHDGEVDGQHYFDTELNCPACGWDSWYPGEKAR